MAEPLLDRIAQAIGDPGSIVGRKLGPSWGPGNDGYAETEETVIRWSARAVAAVLREIERNGRYSASVDIKNMPCTLGDDGWAELERRADEASYPTKWVRDRRRRDDFTTATIESAYQYGYRQAAKVAYGGGEPLMARPKLPSRREQADRRHYVFTYRCGCPFGLVEEGTFCKSEDDAWDSIYDDRAEERRARAEGIRAVYMDHETYSREFYPRMTQKCPHREVSG